jgi:4-amino-4-deoxy-L-arabinose transferase-like glycosyltransferase
LNFDFFPSDQKTHKSFLGIPSLGIIFSIWFVGAICDRVWYSLDNSVPAWDQADYLNGALNYWNGLQNPQWLNGEWWRSLWLLSNKIPPLHYILTTPFFDWFGLNEDAASIGMLVYSGMLLVAVYGLGVILFNQRIGIYAAIICQLLPGLYYYRLEFLLDYPLTAITVFSFWLLTLWKVKQKKSWLFSIAFGISLGLAILLKQTALFFLLIPLLWLLIGYFKNRQWLRISQLVIAICVAIGVCYPWYRTNWLLMLTSGKRATLDSAIAEGDPALNSINAWLYYFKTLPFLLSWHLLLIPVVGLLLYLISKGFKLNFYRVPALTFNDKYGIGWLLIYASGGYLLSSFNINKDTRYILPLLPIIALLLSVGLLSYSKRWRNYLAWLTISLAFVLMLLNIFPLPGAKIPQILSPRTQHHPYLGQPYPHQEIVQEIIKTDPYLRTTLGVLPSTPEINQHNFSFYGGLQNFQVVGRQVGIKENEVIKDMRSLNWFIMKTGDQGSVPEAQASITKLISKDANFQLHKSWQLPDKSKIKLYRAIKPQVEIIIASKEPYLAKTIQLNKVQLLKKSLPGKVINVTYQWLGSGKQLSQGIVLLTWKLKPQQDTNNQGENKILYSNLSDQDISQKVSTNWLHDHSIGMGMLANNRLNSQDYNDTFQVMENTAMLIPENIALGQYELQATYLNRYTKESYKIPIPETTILVDTNTQPRSTTELNQELDLVTQLRTISPTMASGIKALEPIFTQTARINQYDGQQDYLKQTEIALSYRLQNNQATTQQKLNWSYAVALSQVLQQDVQGAIATWQNITHLEPNNPYNYAYLAFVYLYNWQPKLAETALNKAEALNHNISEVTTLQGVAALMQGNLIKAWKLLV